MSGKDKKLSRRGQKIREKVFDPDQHTNLRFRDVEWFLKSVGYVFGNTKNGYLVYHSALKGCGPNSGPLAFDRIHSGGKTGYEISHKFLKYVKRQLLMLEELGIC